MKIETLMYFYIQFNTQMGDNSNSSNEIDLRLVYNSVKQFFLNIWIFFVTIFFIAKKRWVLVFVFFIFGIGAGIGLFLITRPTYISTITLSSSTLRNDFCSDMIEELELIVKDKTPELLSEKLHISTSLSKEIQKIEFINYDENLQEKYKDRDTIVLGLPFKIKVYASDNGIFDTLQTSIVNYLENNNYAIKRKKIKKQEIELMREKLKKEMHDLDSLKNVVASNLLPRGSISGFVFGQPIDPVNIYKEGIKLFQSDLDLSKDLILIDNIEIVSGFSARNKPDSPKLWKTTTAGGSTGLLLGLLVAIILERRKRI